MNVDVKQLAHDKSYNTWYIPDNPTSTKNVDDKYMYIFISNYL